MPAAHAMDIPTRRANCADLRVTITQRLREQSSAHWESVMHEAGIPFGPVNSLQQVIDDPQVHDRGLIVEPENLSDDEIRRVHVRQPLKFDGVGYGPTRGVPKLGEHTREVLTTTAGMRSDEVSDLIERGTAAERAADTTDTSGA